LLPIHDTSEKKPAARFRSADFLKIIPLSP